MDDVAAAPPPPPPDLNLIYRPDDDAHVRHSIVAPLEEGPEARLPTTFEEVLGLPPPPTAPAPPVQRLSEEAAFEDVLGLRPQAAQDSVPLLDLLDDPSPGPQPGEAGKQGGLLSELPAGVSAAVLEKKANVVDLSTPKPEETAETSASPGAPRGPSTAAAAATAASGLRSAEPAPQARPIPTDAKGFGSEDLFGNGSQERTMKDEAVSALSTVYEMLPDQVKDKAKPFIPDCMEAAHDDHATEQVIPGPPGRPAARGVTQGGSGAGLAAGAGQRGPPAPSSQLEEQHTQAAVDRACNGKWVPTYMRHQLAQNGHTTLPAGAPNAHEHVAGGTPPSLGDAFAGMGEDLGSSAQTMLTYMLAFLSSLATQCQMCSHQAASNVHEQVVSYGENLCYGAQEEQFEDSVMLGRPLSEAAAGLGPVRSQLRSHVQVSFASLLQVAKLKLVTPVAPPEFQLAVRARELAREVRSPDSPTESWLFNTQVSPEAVPVAAQPHLCPQGQPLACHETWYVETQEERAEVEISSAPAGGAVTVVLRVVLSARAAAEGGGCDVESRLFARPRGHGEALPLGLVEQLSQVHQSYAASLEGAVVALARERTDEAPVPAPAPSSKVQEREPLPVAQLQIPERQTPPSWTADPTVPDKCAAQPRFEPSNNGIDSSMLLQVAERI